MLKQMIGDRYRFLTAVLAAISVIFLFLTFEPAQKDNDVYCPKGTSAEECIQDLMAEKVALYTEVLAYFTVGLVIVGSFGGWLTLRQLELTRESLNVAERSLTINEWPYLHITEPHFRTRLSYPPSEVPKFTCKILVHGRSPAIIRAYRSALIFSDAVPSIPHKNAGWSFRDGTITSDSSFDGWANWSGNAVPEKHETPAHLQAGKRYYAIFGVVYDDLFGHMHEVGFCYRGELTGGMGARAGGASHNYHRIREDQKEREAIESLLGANQEKPRQNIS